MCGIVGAVGDLGSETGLVSGLVEGLRVLEYRGYDSAGVAVEVDGALATWALHLDPSVAGLEADLRWSKRRVQTTPRAVLAFPMEGCASVPLGVPATPQGHTRPPPRVHIWHI